MGLNIKNKISQISMEYLIMIGIITLIAIISVAYTLQPKKNLEIEEAQNLLTQIVSNSENVIKMGAGNKLKAKIQIPEGISNITFKDNQVKLSLLLSENKLTELHQDSNIKITGFFEDSNFTSETYDLIFESFNSGTCIYTPGNRSDYCGCFTSDLSKYYTKTSEIYCKTKNGIVDLCENINFKYGDTISQLKSKCTTLSNNIIDGYVVFKIVNWNNKVVYESTTYNHDSNGYFILNDNYKIQNSGPLNISAKCYHECSAFNPDVNELISENESIPMIPYGTILPFLINKNGQKVYSNQSNYFLINPTNQNKDYYEKGWVKSGDIFIIRTGFDCIGGECVNVNASLWHAGQ